MAETSGTGERGGAAVLPSIDALAQDAALAGAIAAHGRTRVIAELRLSVAAAREGLRGAAAVDPVALRADILARVLREVDSGLSLKRVFNLTGTVLHTNLGRAPLAAEAVAAMADAAGASNIEYELESGGRGERDDHAARLIRELTGAEACVVVNNNAAAVLLALNSLARGKEVVVSRGELIEIGGAFRIPDVMARAGARLVEVGTTNRTHPGDFANAIGPRTAALMKVHPSNYAIAGFSSAVSEAELAGIAHSAGIPLIADLGSGSLVDLRRWGLPHEPLVQDVLAAGADLVTFSGDKLLGGPQAGIVVGRADLIAKLKKNPLKRALRVDKLIMAALVATLELYRDPERLAARLPGLRLLSRPADEIRGVAERMAGPLGAALEGVASVSVVDCASQIGSGSLPVDRMASFALRIEVVGPRKGSATRLADLAARLRALKVPVIGRVQEGALLLDCRCLEDEAGFVAQLARLRG